MTKHPDKNDALLQLQARLSRRTFVNHSVALSTALLLPPPLMSSHAQAAAEEGEPFGPSAHGLSIFDGLLQKPDFKYFDYVNPHAPKGGLLALQIKNTTGNQAFQTFDTFNIFVTKGAGAAGIEMSFDTLMASSSDEPNAMYGLVASSVRSTSDHLRYRFTLRPEARFHDGSPLTAHDAAYSFLLLKNKGHVAYRALLTQLSDARALSDHELEIIFTPQRSRDLHLIIAGLPIFSRAYYSTHDFEASSLEAPLGSGPYKLARFEQGRFVEFERVKNYWAETLPVNVGINNFDHIRYDYYRERQIGFEAFKSGQTNFNEEYTARLWATAYDFPAVLDGRVKKIEVPSGMPVGTQGWVFNLRRPHLADPHIRRAIALAFDFEWTNRNIMYSAYQRTTSYFENSPRKASGLPSPEELALLEPFRASLSDEVFGEPWVPPQSDGSGSDRALLKQADDLFKQAGCTRAQGKLLLPNGMPLKLEFLDSNGALQPHTEPFQANLRRLGIEATTRLVDDAQYVRRLQDFDFDIVSLSLGGSPTPGDELRLIYGSEAAKMSGSRNLGGVSSPAIDAMLERISQAQTREELDLACRVLDRLLRAGAYWVPMWYRNKNLIAYWDVFERPQRLPQFSTGAPATWWWDDAKAKGITTGHQDH